MKKLITIILSEENEPQFTTYFFHKEKDSVFKVVSDGRSCSITLAERIEIGKDYKSGSYLPKYILNKLINYDY